MCHSLLLGYHGHPHSSTVLTVENLHCTNFRTVALARLLNMDAARTEYEITSPAFVVHTGAHLTCFADAQVAAASNDCTPEELLRLARELRAQCPDLEQQAHRHPGERPVPFKYYETSRMRAAVTEMKEFAAQLEMQAQLKMDEERKWLEDLPPWVPIHSTKRLQGCAGGIRVTEGEDGASCVL